MQAKKIKKFLTLHWQAIAVFGAITITILLIIVFTAISFYHFMTIESYLRKSMLAGMFSYIFLWLVVGSLTGFIHTILWIFLVFGGGFARLTHKRVKESEVNVKWRDVVGMEQIKREVWEVINLVKDRASLKQMGGQIIKGVLMVGPPGCGKTYLAKAIATETGLPFLAAVGSEFVGIFVGQGALAVKSLFKKARVLAEIHGGCLIFIDEIDSVARPRAGDSLGNIGAETAHNATVNQLLAEMDGLKQATSNIVVMAATNVDETKLDPALMRAGRFDRKLYVGRPGLDDRKKLFEFYLKKTDHDLSIDTAVLARRALWFSAADIANMVQEATLVAIRNRRRQVIYKDLSEAYDRVIYGLKSGITVTEREKKWIAYHEAGHAIIAYLIHPTDDIVKATIIPHKGALGFVAPRPKEELHTHTKEWFLAGIKCSLGGYVAEKIKFGTTSSGVTSDFENALWLAHQMVFNYGMGTSGFLGNFDVLTSRLLSEETKRKMDDDVQKILRDCLTEVDEILTREKELLEHFAHQLLEKDELEYDEIVEIFQKYGKERPAENSL